MVLPMYLNGVGVQVSLALKVWLAIRADVMADQGDRHDEGQQAPADPAPEQLLQQWGQRRSHPLWHHPEA
jgi:hypothetical protein